MRLIDADALLKRYTVNKDGQRIPEIDCDNFPVMVSIADVKKQIRNALTVAAAPEVHGRWVKGTSCDLYWNYCSICGGKILKNEYQQDYFSDYCPFCGARMDGGEGAYRGR